MSATEHDVRDMCHTCGDWFWVSDGHTCSRTALYLPPGLTPTDLPAERPGTTVRYSIDEQFRVQLKAALTHPAETVVRRPVFAKEFSL